MKKRIQQCLLIFVGSVLFAALEVLILKTPAGRLGIGRETFPLHAGLLVMAVCACSFGPCAGGFVGLFGALTVVMYDYGGHIFQHQAVLERAVRQYLGMAVGNFFAGVILGAAYGGARKNAPVRLWTHLMFAILASGLGLLAIRSVMEQLLRGVELSFWLRRNLYECLADAAILLVSYFVCTALDPLLKNLFPVLTRGGEKAEESHQNDQKEGTDTNGGI